MKILNNVDIYNLANSNAVERAENALILTNRRNFPSLDFLFQSSTDIFS